MSEGQIQKGLAELVKKADQPREFARELQEFLRSTSVREYQEKYIQRIVPEAGKVFGAPVPVLRMIADGLGRYGQKNPKRVLATLKLVWRSGSFEERVIVAKSLEKVGKADYEASFELIRSFLKDISDWAVCDNLAMFSMKPIITSCPDKVLLQSAVWAKDENKWIRRFGVVTLYSLGRDKKHRISGKEFGVVELLMKDNDPDVKKAVAWILRVISKKDSKKVFEFLIKHAKNANKDTRWIIKDGMKKLPTKSQEEILSTLRE